jgi:hypothetical protein
VPHLARFGRCFACPCLALLALLPGCTQEVSDRDARIPGDLLGTYHVVGDLGDSTCGPGALDAPEVWEFDVRLSRADSELFWLNGAEAIEGEVAADGVSFTFESFVLIEAQPKGKGRDGCRITRTDSVEGRLGSSSLDVHAFAGKITYGYSADAQSDCSDFIGVQGGFGDLPCDLAYKLEGERTSEPPDSE